MKTDVQSILLVLTASVTSLAAQPARDQSTLASQPNWRVPIHSMPDDPTFGTYGTWAAGRRYKASFHDGFRFYTALGRSAPRSLPIRWTTTNVRVGGQELLDDRTPIGHHTSWRYVYRIATGVREIYDVRPDGVKQSFIIERPATGVGAIEIVARWSGDLDATLEPISDSIRAAIRFTDRDGRSIAHYGAAIAFDADGRKTEVHTELDQDSIRLIVPEQWARDASWPVTIDPLFAPETVRSFGVLDSEIEQSDVAVALSNHPLRAMTTFSLPISATDIDAYAVLTDEDFRNPAIVFSDLSSSYDSVQPRVAYVDQAGRSGRWTIAFARQSFSAARIRVWLHDGSSTTHLSGSMMSLPNTTPTFEDRRPDIGGARQGNRALLVYESNFPGAAGVDDGTAVFGVYVNANTGGFSPTFHLDSSLPTFFDYENPTVTQIADGSPLGWMVCYQHRSGGSDWQLEARRIAADGTTSASKLLIDSLPGEPNHEVKPSIDGANTRYCVSYLLASSAAATSGTKLAITRFFWAPSATAPNVDWSSIIETTNPSTFEVIVDPRTVADVHTGQFGVAYGKRRPLGVTNTIRAARVGFDGQVVESVLAQGSILVDGTAPGIAYDLANTRFMLTYGTDTTGAPVEGRVWTYPSDATNFRYGAGCGPSSFGVVSPPLVGTEFFRVRLTGAPPLTNAVLWAGTQRASIDLGPVGMPGCDLLVDPASLVALPAATNHAGDALVTIIGLRSATDLYMRWAYLEPRANPLGIRVSGGMRSSIR